MNILDKIIAQKKIEVEESKANKSIAALEAMPAFSRTCFSLTSFLRNPEKTGIISEFKRRSPSKGWINENADVLKITTGYTNAGASCLSVLTDEVFFGGSIADLQQARVNKIPILRKDFMIDDYQIIEAKAIGADVILLIAANLSPQQVKQLSATAKNNGLEVLLEIHGEEELEHICDTVDVVGVNNRNLKTFEVDIETSVQISKLIPSSKLKISESGISDVSAIHTLRKYGYEGFLIGENFMKSAEPETAFARFVEQLK